ncbi:relA/spoT family protein [Clostridium perfringens]|nr:relA/spoT family protein [Clostridium perfringens]
MELKVFEFTKGTLELLKDIKKELAYSANLLDDFFYSLLENSCEGFFNISTRVKSASSLKEKIIRHNYYLKYNSPKDLFENLSDLIGVRIECRFIEDEEHIFKFIRTVFNCTNEEGFYYSSQNPNIFLDLNEHQPLKQKNGFELYRIDGFVVNEGEKFNFELQIKSMVNNFWGEIEHKIIYKNYNMILGDKFYKNILHSIKNNLCLIDNQLLTIFNHVNSNINNTPGMGIKKEGIELLLSKMIYDIYSSKVKNELGISIDFRNACDIIIDYIFTKNNCNTSEEYYTTFINTSVRLNEVFKNSISFKNKLSIGNEPLDFDSDFSTSIGNKLAHAMNYDFHWNLFFKILFQIEPGNNREDFYSFISYLETIFSKRDSYLNLYLIFSSDEVSMIKEDILSALNKAFLEIDSLKFIYRDKLSEIFNVIDDHVKFLCENMESYEGYSDYKYLYTEYLYLNIVSIFNAEINKTSILEFVNELKNSKCKLRISYKGIKLLASNNINSLINTGELLEQIYIR